MKTLIITSLLLLGFSAAHSSEPSNTVTEVFKKATDYAFDGKNGASDTNSFMPVLPSGVSIQDLGPRTREKYEIALQGYFDYRTSGYQHRKAVFKWQLFSSKCIFAIVVLLVCVGVYFSWMQFSRSLESKPSPDGAGEKSGDRPQPASVTELVASAEGIKVSSPILGVIILMISLLFFYLYLVFVYPIQDLL